MKKNATEGVIEVWQTITSKPQLICRNDNCAWRKC